MDTRLITEPSAKRTPGGDGAGRPAHGDQGPHGDDCLGDADGGAGANDGTQT